MMRTGLVGTMPSAGKQLPRRLLTVGMATYDDFDGAYFTIMSLRLYHPEVADRISILVVDNNPTGPAARALKRLEVTIPGVRYVPVADVTGTAVRDRVFAEANSEWVLCMDSHVQLVPGALSRLVDFIGAHPDGTDLLQGPLLDVGTESVATHWDPVWYAGMFGVWATDQRGVDPDGEPFEIGMQGLGLFCCRVDAWPWFNPRFRGHGGEEGYLHQKFRAAGRRTLCLPFLRWTHRFDRPAGVPFPMVWNDRVRNYLIGWEELGLPTAPVLDHFRDLIGADAVQSILARYEAEQASPFAAFDAIVCINLDRRPDRWVRMYRRFEALGIAERVRRVSAVETPDNHHIGCALSHRRVIEQARRQGWNSVLVFEDDVLFLQGTIWLLRRAMAELNRQPWTICYLGGIDWGRTFPRLDGCTHLERVHHVTTTHALAYHHSIYDRLLTDLPDTVDGMRAWVANHDAIDQYLAVAHSAVRVVPVVATQENLLSLEPADLRDQFVADTPDTSSAVTTPDRSAPTDALSNAGTPRPGSSAATTAVPGL